MRFQIILPPKPGGVFERSITALLRRYPRAADDIAQELAELVGPSGPPIPCGKRVSLLVGISYTIVKVRAGSSDMKRGRSGSFRVLLVQYGPDTWQPVLAYAKVQDEDVPRQDILAAIREDIG